VDAQYIALWKQKLTFHFWSGDKVTYTVVRGGTTVTGTD
jgi:hypothetical protein